MGKKPIVVTVFGQKSPFSEGFELEGTRKQKVLWALKFSLGGTGFFPSPEETQLVFWNLSHILGPSERNSCSPSGRKWVFVSPPKELPPLKVVGAQFPGVSDTEGLGVSPGGV